MKLTIIGAGPRGLAVAIQAVKLNFEVDLIDYYPIQSWDTNTSLIDFIMRSPSTFDLVTGISELQDWSLNRFLNLDENINDYFCLRSEFESYLKYVFNRLKRYKRFNFIQDKVLSLNKQENLLILEKNQEYKYEHLIVTIGNDKEKDITWLDKSIFKTKIKDDSFLIQNEIKDKKILIIGSGQGAAELVLLLKKENDITWLLKKEYKINQYPIPSYKDWKNKTCFSNYYQTLSLNEKYEYLKEVKKFTPTITPNVAFKVRRVNKIISNKIDLNLKEFDYIFKKNGYENDFRNSFLKELPLDLFFINKIQLNSKFRCPSYSIYISGALATHIGGPSQNSIFSAASTAKIILNDLI